MISVIYEDNHILVVEKPINIPVQEDQSNDLDFLNMLKQMLKEKYQKPGNVYLGLVHRLDRPVGGVMVFAKTSKAASRLSENIRLHAIKKTYLAITSHTVSMKHDIWTDYLIKDSKTNMVRIAKQHENGAKLAKLTYDVLNSNQHTSLLKIDLITGRAHQIRVQSSSRGYALWGDQRYNAQAKVGQQIALWSYALSFPHPITKDVMTFYSIPKGNRPWEDYYDQLQKLQQ